MCWQLENSGNIEIKMMDNDSKNKVYMNIDTGDMFIYFLANGQEDRLLKSILSYIKDDGEVVWKGATQMTLGSFGAFRVELLKDDDKLVLLIAGGNARASMRYDLDKQTFMEACKNALEDI